MDAGEHTTIEGSWENMWAPYDETTYRDVLKHIGVADIVLDIGAGDLRLTRRIAAACQRVYAIEIQEALLNKALVQGVPENLKVIHGDARQAPFPSIITTGVLLMRHCNHFQIYADKLRQVGARKLITNARWRMDVEAISLQCGRIPFQEVDIGWYACWCGATGFKAGPAEDFSSCVMNVTFEVDNCPHCSLKCK